jgi:hypothetical protein
MLRIHDALLHTVSFCLLVGVITVINTDVSRHLGNLTAGGPSSGLAAITAPVNRYGRVVFDTVNLYRTDNDFLFWFAVAAVVLVVALFKS